ncbi:AraC family transcriptional regulator [Nocardia seriolae]|uniref:AraC family transcriptional regulator n=1 Tax=Nocardia seriolae TaxID=37332 RepID=A0A0B8N971_9NOCA|nr:AraC family transcriptional regulator [Nocardia seriolae]APA96221.1 HTH-type transcriptional regulator VirS [Nocardia seriolae]MTJ65704.1 helix-turn-helix domain-containing protein [Nocardia seriolae]MTJ71646.1 helix-turn-helix domain-containing protein [Nocardia seriolae]MTJ86363.1 helix-turn-helix domain-containing protein [Nocardia seriolae]MTK30357.1 helix-turn-helix domain-containing protein [Nocardia seriolae]
MAVMARAASLRGYRELVDELGGDGLGLLRRFGLTPEAIESDDAVVSAEALGWALEIAAAELDCPDLGLRLADRQDADVLGLLAVAFTNATTVGEAIACASRFLSVQHAGVSIGLVPDPYGHNGILALNYRDTAELSQMSQGIDHAAGLIHRHLLRGAGDYGLRTVHLPHPARAPRARYTEFFGADVCFDMPTTVFRIPAELLERPVIGGNPMLHKLAMDFLERNYPEPDRSMTTRVRVAIDRAFLESKADIDTVTRMLAVHERTLQRAPAAEGTTFTEVLDAARRDSTYRLLCETDLPMSRITTLIGLREQSALTRVVRRWYGITPQQVRSAARTRRANHPGQERVSDAQGGVSAQPASFAKFGKLDSSQPPSTTMSMPVM